MIAIIIGAVVMLAALLLFMVYAALRMASQEDDWADKMWQELRKR